MLWVLFMLTRHVTRPTLLQPAVETLDELLLALPHELLEIFGLRHRELTFREEVAVPRFKVPHCSGVRTRLIDLAGRVVNFLAQGFRALFLLLQQGPIL